MSSFRDKLENVRRNPALMQYLVYDELDKMLNGDEESFDIPDATLPFAYAMECGIVETSMAIDEMESISRTLFPKLALEHSDLYKHMSDDDYIGRFASPAKTTFELLLSHDDIVAKAVPYGDSGNKRLVIPRFTEFKVAEVPFTMQYPINIDVFPHGGMNIVYDGSVTSPIESLRTNILDWDMLLIDRKRIVNIKIPVYQMQLDTYIDSLSPSTLFNTDYRFDNRFFHARAYMDTDNGWTEVYSTHSDLVYDPTRITVVFKVVGDKLQVSIPTIYTNLGLVRGSVRIDIYTTIGAIERELADYNTSQFSYNLNDIDDDSTYVSPLKTFSIAQPLSRAKLEGGSNNIDLMKLRDRVVYDTLGPADTPITNIQLSDAVDRRGYQLVTNIDNITNRQFLATKKLGKPRSLDLVSGAGLAMVEWIMDMEQLRGSEHVYDNGDSITIKPSLLYRFDNSTISPLTSAEIDRIVNLRPDNIARESALNRFMYTPFYTLLDVRGDTFDVRPYHLDAPIITEKTFVGDNPSSDMQATISDYQITKTQQGYEVLVEVEMSEALFKLNPENVIVQLGYQPPNETRWASINSEFVERIESKSYYVMHIDTNHDIDSKGFLQTTNMSMFSLAQTNFRTPLTVDLELTIILNGFVGANYKTNVLDSLIQPHLLDNRFMVITRERLKTVLGYDLSSLWRRARTVLGSESYQVWETNVPDVYDSHVYELDVDGNIKLTVNSSGELEYTILHQKGDPKLDINGEPIYKYFKGQPKYDLDGNPVLVAPRQLKRELSVLMVDGIFYLGNDAGVNNYRKELAATIVDWLQNDMDYLNARLLEISRLFLYPTNTFGDCKVSIQEDQIVTIPIEQSLTVKFYLSSRHFNNQTLRPMLIESTKDIINETFERRTVAISDIISKIRNVAGEYVMGIDVLGLGGSDNNFDVVTVEDEATRLTIKKKLTVLSNEEMIVEDDVNFIFLTHN